MPGQAGATPGMWLRMQAIPQIAVHAVHYRVARIQYLPDPSRVSFEIISEIKDVTTIARGAGIRDRRRLSRCYGRGGWLKRKGFADVRLEDGAIVFAEIHWYEAQGIGKREFKLKRIHERPPYG